MKLFKRMICSFLICCMLLNASPMPFAMAADDGSVTPQDTSISLRAAYCPELSGTCGPDLEWTLSNFVLTITGTGNMDDFSFNSPWYDSKSSVRTVVISEGVTSIGSFAFYECNLLQSVSLPESITSIGAAAFYNCSTLETVQLPSAVSSIASDAFYGCNSLNSIDVAPENSNYSSVDGVLFDCAKTQLILFPSASPLTSFVIPDSVSDISNSSFDLNSSNLLHLTLPQSMTSVNTYNLPNSLLTLTIPATATYIDSLGKNKLHHVYYGGTEEQWNTLTQYCYIPEYVTVHYNGSGNPTEDIIPYAVAGGSIYLDTASGTIIHADSTVTTANIPQAISGVTVTSIGDSAFYQTTKLTSVTLPDTITSIGSAAFWSSALEYINLPEGLATIGGSAFSGSRLISVTIPSTVDTISSSAFENCSFLTNLTITEGVTTIRSWAFNGCSALTTVTIPSSTTNVEAQAFAYCYKLTSVTFHGNGITFGALVFDQCTNLKSVYFKGSSPRALYNARSSNATFPSSVTLYCLEGKDGWTANYDSSTQTWLRYPLIFQEDVTKYRYITPLQPDGITINGKGNAIPHFRLTDYYGQPLTAQAVTCVLDGKETISYTDGNGVFSMTINNCNTGTYTATFFIPDFEYTLKGAEQEITVNVTSPSYSQTWNGALGANISLGIGGGASFAVGVASAEASLASAGASLGMGYGLDVKNEVSNGEHALEVKFVQSLDAEGEFKSGAEATVPTITVELASASAGVNVGGVISYGLRLENYDPENMDQAAALGEFLLQMALSGSNSVLALQIIDQLDVSNHNLSGYELKALLDAGASAFGAEASNATHNYFSIVGGDAALSYSSSIETDHSNNTTTRSMKVAQDLSGGFLQGSDPDDPWLDQGSNALEMSVKFQGSYLDELTYRVYEDGKKDILFGEKTAQETYRDYIYDSEEAAKILTNITVLDDFAMGDRLLLGIDELSDAQTITASGNYTAVYNDANNIKGGNSFEFPFELEMIAGGGFALSGTTANEYSYTTNSGIWINGTEYQTAQSTMSEDDMAAYRVELGTLFGEAIQECVQYLYDKFEQEYGWIGQTVATVSNTYTSVGGGLPSWYASIKTTKAPSVQSYALMSLASEAEPISNAAVSSTIGDPCSVTIYTDDSMSTLVSDEELAATPLNITMSYTDEMLSAAGVSAAADIDIYRFDAERNVYVRVGRCDQDRTNKTVSTAISQNGEYILATDNAAPLVSDFATDNLTGTPTITALISDLSGIGRFRFWLDSGRTLVDTNDLENYYDSTSGLFTYPVTQPLSSGEHIAHFQVYDKLANTTTEPFSFTFTVDAEAPVITDVVTPTETVIDPDGFSVTASVTDNSQLSQVLLHVTTNRGVISLPMTNNEGLWTAKVTDIAGCSSVAVKVVAVDQAGNRSVSPTIDVIIDVPSIPSGIILSGTWTTSAKRAVDISVQVKQSQAVGGCVLAVVYDVNGKQLCFSDCHIGLTGNSEDTFTLTFPAYSGTAAYCKLFLLKNNGSFSPLCNPGIIH